MKILCSKNSCLLPRCRKMSKCSSVFAERPPVHQAVLEDAGTTSFLGAHPRGQHQVKYHLQSPTGASFAFLKKYLNEIFEHFPDGILKPNSNF